mmetsp:Transcript_3200/g.4939  ORF Transcript_3200/g.4939 Transcript_3200/m.4939 type:complete len:89 (+) Transcript_3200:521-787(+)
MVELVEAGLHGVLGSTNATHFGMWHCPYGYQNCHDFFKLDMPTMTYNFTVQHGQNILSATRGHPVRENDKTLILYNALAVVGLNKGKL